MAMYNPVTDQFTYYTPTETPKVELENPLSGMIDISDWASRVTPGGTPIVKANTPQSQEFDTSFLDRMAETHSDSSAQQSSANVDLKGNQKKAMSFFMSKGLSAHHAAGIVGNLMGESQLNEAAVNPTSKAYGIAQWLGDRKKKLFKKYGEKPSFDQQLEFIWEELNTNEKSAYNRLLQTQSVEEAINSFMKHFERPSQREMAQSINNRLKYGRGLLA